MKTLLEGGSEKEGRLVFLHFAKLLKTLQRTQSSLYQDAWHRLNTVFQTQESLEYRHFLCCYILASCEQETQYEKVAKSTRFAASEIERNSEKSKVMLPISPGFYCQEPLLSLLENCIQRALHGAEIKEGAYIFSLEILNHFPSVNLSNSNALLEKLIDIEVLTKVKVPLRELHVQLCIALLTHPMMKNQDLEKAFYDRVTGYEDQDWVLAFISGLLQGGKNNSDDDRIKAFISSPTFLQKLGSTLKAGDSKEKRSLLKTALQFGK